MLVKEADGSWQIDSLTYVEFVDTEVEDEEEAEDAAADEGAAADENTVVVDGEITDDETQSGQEQSTVSSN